MVEAAGVFDAWGSALLGGLVGGVLGALVALLVVYLTQRHERALRREESLQQTCKDLMAGVANVRDEALWHRDGHAGWFSIAELRTQIYASYSDIHELPAYHELWEFYRRIRAYRDWAREHREADNRKRLRSDVFEPAAERRKGLNQFANEVIKLLQRPNDPLPGGYKGSSTFTPLPDEEPYQRDADKASPP